ncbi:MAG: twin-arginine translocase TatA/TatE family subunit [Bacteroides sp.]|nr:twin-arginine translocase TatA/TatE family subunit [Ruminococcus flavefaciens]MCM1554471.1 twin-arginine translocase TatA/TatE family subunit [Bacteroides sp.]
MTNMVLLGILGWPELLALAVLVLLLFGGKKIPELMKGLGKGVRSFKDGVNGVEKDLDVKEPESPSKSENKE